MEGQPNHESNSISWNVPSAPELTFNPSEAREEKARGPGINTALRGTLHQGGWESGVVSGMNAPKAEPTPPQPLPFFARTTPLTKSPHGWSGLAHGTVRTACSLPAAETPSLLCPVPDATCLSPGPGQSPLEPLYSVPRSFSQRPPPSMRETSHTHTWPQPSLIALSTLSSLSQRSQEVEGRHGCVEVRVTPEASHGGCLSLPSEGRG